MNAKMTRLSWIAVIVTVLLVSVLSMAGLSCGGKGPEATKHTISTGAKVDLTTQTISTSGGVINISKPGDPLDGLQIEVPSGSYPNSKTFNISYAPVTGHDFGENFNPISPLITIDNGGSYSDELITVKIPIQLPDDQFAMAFYYDDSSGKLEGIPLVDEDKDSITIVTRHFSNLLVSRIALKVLTGVFDSGFRPGVDDWQFDNDGSYIEPDGHCSGQSITSMWYYYEKTLNGASHLYGRYDNNGGKKTPNFWWDDSLGYRLASTVHVDIAWGSLSSKIFRRYLAGLSDELTWKAFAYSILITGEPQYVAVRQTATDSGHAMVVYKVTNDALYVADPNYHGNTERKIEFAGGKFKPYNSGANAAEIAAGRGKAYDLTIYVAKTALVSWGQVATRWQEFEDKTIGNDRFPAYTLKVVGEQLNETELTDGFKTKSNILTLWMEGTGLGNCVYRDGQQLQPTQPAGYEYPLRPGNNELGIYILGQVNNKWKYVDFKYYNVVYEAPTPTPTPKASNHPVVESIGGPTSIAAWPAAGGPYKYTLKITGGKPPYQVEWRGNNIIYSGTGYESVDILRDQMRDNGEGYWVFITVKDSAGTYALWVDEVGFNKQEFTYGVLYNGTVMTVPATFPYKTPAG